MPAEIKVLVIITLQLKIVFRRKTSVADPDPLIASTDPLPPDLAPDPSIIK